MGNGFVNLKKVGLLFKKELRFFFFSPIAYIFICIFLILVGWFFFSDFFLYNQVDLRVFFERLPIFLSLIVPVITMGLFSEEFSVGSYEIISTTSVSLWDIILGKFFAVVAFMIIALIPTLIYPLSISFLGELDFGPVIGGYIGSIFLIGALASIGLFTSALTKNQIVALIIAFAITAPVCIIIPLMKWNNLIPMNLMWLMDFISVESRFGNIAKGIIDIRDLLYFLSIIAIGLYSTRLILESRK